MFRKFMLFILLGCFLGYGGLSGSDTLWSTFNDAVDGGSSETEDLIVDSNQVTWIFRLSDGIRYPYIGLIFELHETDLPSSFVEEDSIVVQIRSNREGYVYIQLATFDPDFYGKSEIAPYRILESDIFVTKESQRISLALGQFRVASWWKQRYGIPASDNNLFLDSLCLVDWGVSDTLRIGSIDTLIIEDLNFVKADKKVSWVLYLVLISLLYVSMMVMRWMKKFQKKADEKKNSSVSKSLQPKHVQTGPTEWERVLNYFEKKYIDPDLSLKKVADDLGFSESRLSRLIREKHSDGFRSLIHDLRIEESKRLLVETDCNIAEIAYTIGYATPNHFNREFKQRIGKTPTQYRSETTNKLGESVPTPDNKKV